MMAGISPALKKAEISIRQRVECEEKAFHIVNKLIDGCVDGEYLAQCGKRISQENYNDIVEERSITKLCGYPICDQPLPNMPKKKYHISTKANKVYDISERKNFCSNQCFKASKIFQNQIPESPVWSRERETVNIVVSPHKQMPGLVGDEVIGGRPKQILERELEKLEELDKKSKHSDNKDNSKLKRDAVADDGTKVLNNNKSSSKNYSLQEREIELSDETPQLVGEDESLVEKIQNDFDQMALDDNSCSRLKEIEGKKVSDLKNDADGDINAVSDEKKDVHVKDTDTSSSHSSSKLEQLQNLLSRRKNVLSKMVDLQESDNPNQHQQNKSSVIDQSVDKTSQQSPKSKPAMISPITKSATKAADTHVSSLSPLQQICQVLKKWISVTSIEYLRYRMASSKPNLQEPVTAKLSELQIRVDTENILRNLDDREIELSRLMRDGSNDALEEGGGDGAKGRKSIPNYKVLQDEAEQFQLKVTEFITGKRPTKDKNKKEEDVEPDVFLPVVDAYDQSQIRVKIVLERLDKALPDVLVPMGLAVQDVASYIRELVYTFRLEKDTIVFKPAEWTMVSVFLLKMLSIRRVRSIEEAFNKDSTVRYFTVLMERINHRPDDLDLFVREILSDAAVSFDSS